MRTDDDAPLVARDTQRNVLFLIFVLLSSSPNPDVFMYDLSSDVLWNDPTISSSSLRLIHQFSSRLFGKWRLSRPKNALSLIVDREERLSSTSGMNHHHSVLSNVTRVSEFVKLNPYPRSVWSIPLFKGRKACVGTRLGQLRVVFHVVILKETLEKSTKHRGSEACMRITLRMIKKERAVVSSTNCPESITNERWAFLSYCEDCIVYVVNMILDVIIFFLI